MKFTYNKVFVHFDSEITNYGAAAEVISQFTRFKEKPGFYSSRYLYSNQEILDARKDNLDEPFGIYLDNLNFAVVNLDHPHEQYDELTNLKGVRKVNPNATIKIDKRDAVPGTEPDNWGIRRMNLENINLNGERVKIAVLDSGIDLTHPAFKGKIDPSRTINLIRPNEDVQDYFGHGTHIAGIIAGNDHPNGIKHGIAQNSELYIGKVINDNGGIQDKDWVLNGIDWAIEQKCNLVNLSLGFAVRDGRIDEEFQEAADKAYMHQTMLIASVGNESSRDQTDPDFEPIESPSNCKHVIAVSALDKNDSIYFYANRSLYPAQHIDFIGPGTEIFSTYPKNIHSSGYAHWEGTSQATAFITGLIALYCQQYPCEHPDDILQLLRDNVAPIRFHVADAGLGLPRFNINNQ